MWFVFFLLFGEIKYNFQKKLCMRRFLNTITTPWLGKVIFQIEPNGEKANEKKMESKGSLLTWFPSFPSSSSIFFPILGFSMWEYNFPFPLCNIRIYIQVSYSLKVLILVFFFFCSAIGTITLHYLTLAFTIKFKVDDFPKIGDFACFGQYL